MTGNREQPNDPYAIMPLEARKEMARVDPEAARVMALGDYLILASRVGYRLLEAKAQKDLATLRDMGQSIGLSNQADPDWKENAELQRLKIEVPAYAAVYFKRLRELERTLVYEEDLPGRLSFGSMFEATIQYPDRITPTLRRYLLLGPIESAHWDRNYLDPQTKISFVVISYMTAIGNALWGVPLAGVNDAAIGFPIPDNPQPAVVSSITQLGRLVAE